jgi:hypothetical protein
MKPTADLFTSTAGLTDSFLSECDARAYASVQLTLAEREALWAITVAIDEEPAILGLRYTDDPDMDARAVERMLAVLLASAKVGASRLQRALQKAPTEYTHKADGGALSADAAIALVERAWPCIVIETGDDDAILMMRPDVAQDAAALRIVAFHTNAQRTPMHAVRSLSEKLADMAEGMAEAEFHRR